MATYNFDLLDLADGECGDAAVSVVVSKKKTEEVAAKHADAADPAQPVAHDKPKYSFYTKLQLDEGLRLLYREQKKFRDARRNLWDEEAKLMEQPGNEARLKEVSDEVEKVGLELKKLAAETRTLGPQRVAFYQDNKIPLTPVTGEPKPKKPDNPPPNDADPGSNGNVYNSNDGVSCGYSDYGGNSDEYQTQVCDGGEHYPHGHDERQVERGHCHSNNGDRQGYRQGQPRMKKVYMPKVKASSVAGTEAEEKPEENVVAATDKEQKVVSADNADAVPASESDKSAGGAAQEGPNNKPKRDKDKRNGSEKRKKRNAKKNSGAEPEKVKTQDSEVDGSKVADQQPLEVEKKTLAEYEKMREEKKKTLEASKTEARKVTAEEFKDCQMLEKKKLDDEEAVIKVEKAQPKVKEASKKEEVKVEGKDAAAKNGKPKKVVVTQEVLMFRQPRRVTHVQEDGSSARARFNGGFQGGSRDNSTEPRVNGRAAQNEAGGHNGNGAPRGAYNGRGDGAPRGDYSGHRNGYMGNGGYGYRRGNGGNQGNGGYQQRQGGNVGHYQQERAGNGGYQQQRQGGNVGHYQQERAGNGGYQQRRQGGNVGHYQQERAGNGGYQQQRQGGNVGQYQQERAGNGGYYPQRHHQGSDRYHQQRGNSGDRRNFARVPALGDMSKFPALPVPASARSAAPASAPTPVPAEASAPAAAPAQA